MFREKAIGDNIEEYEDGIEAEIRKEYNLVKLKCIIESKKKCEKAIKKDLDEFYADVRASKYKTEIELQQKVDLMRTVFKESLVDINYKDKDALLDQTCSNMVNAGLKNLLQ